MYKMCLSCTYICFKYTYILVHLCRFICMCNCTIAPSYKYYKVFIFLYINSLNKQAFLYKNVITLFHIFIKQKVSPKSNFQTARMDYDTCAKYQISISKYLKKCKIIYFETDNLKLSRI